MLLRVKQRFVNGREVRVVSSVTGKPYDPAALYDPEQLPPAERTDVLRKHRQGDFELAPPPAEPAEIGEN